MFDGISHAMTAIYNSCVEWASPNCGHHHQSRGHEEGVPGKIRVKTDEQS